jgi:hypothetical protein
MFTAEDPGANRTLLRDKRGRKDSCEVFACARHGSTLVSDKNITVNAHLIAFDLKLCMVGQTNEVRLAGYKRAILFTKIYILATQMQQRSVHYRECPFYACWLFCFQVRRTTFPPVPSVPYTLRNPSVDVVAFLYPFTPFQQRQQWLLQGDHVFLLSPIPLTYAVSSHSQQNRANAPAHQKENAEQKSRPRQDFFLLFQTSRGGWRFRGLKPGRVSACAGGERSGRIPQ